MDDGVVMYCPSQESPRDGAPSIKKILKYNRESLLLWSKSPLCRQPPANFDLVFQNAPDIARKVWKKKADVERQVGSMLFLKTKMHTFIYIYIGKFLLWPCKNYHMCLLVFCVLGGSHYRIIIPFFLLFFWFFNLENESQNYTKRFIRVFSKKLTQLPNFITPVLFHSKLI
jgi:hypothetical protein